MVTVGIFAGTVLTSVGSIIVFTKRDKDRLVELDTQVTGIMLGLEQEFERCHTKIAELELGCSDTGGGIEELRERLREASMARQGPGAGTGPRISLDVVTNVVQNMYNFSQGLRSRVNELPADVRSLLNDSLNQVQYFISPYGASQFMNIIKSIHSLSFFDYSLIHLFDVQMRSSGVPPPGRVIFAAPGPGVTSSLPPPPPLWARSRRPGAPASTASSGRSAR